MSDSVIRRAEEKDIPRILDLLVQVDMVHHLGRPDLFRGPATKYTEEELKSLIQDDSRPVFVYVDDAGVVQGHAFCAFQQHTEDHVLTDIRTLYVDDICVEERCRGQSIGKQLYTYVESFAREHGCYNLTLNVWACNEGARAFYEACGLKPQKIGMERIL